MSFGPVIKPISGYFLSTKLALSLLTLKHLSSKERRERQTRETELLQNFRIYVRVLDWTQRSDLSFKVC
jgi:hypothetical protein